MYSMTYLSHSLAFPVETHYFVHHFTVCQRRVAFYKRMRTARQILQEQTWYLASPMKHVTNERNTTRKRQSRFVVCRFAKALLL